MQVDQGIHNFEKFSSEKARFEQELILESGSEQQVEGAFLELRNVLSFLSQGQEAVSDLDVLKLAMEYIASLEQVLELSPKKA